MIPLTRSARPARWLGLAVASLAVALASATPAQADDAGVLRAWEVNDTQFVAQGRQVTAATVRFRRTGRAGPLFGSLTRTRGLIGRTRQGILAQQPSTQPGADARQAALRALYYLDGSIIHLYRSVRAIQARRSRLAVSLANRGKTLAMRSQAWGTQANALFRQAGLSPR